jgi:GNAT superfamily N-acetyltransferase
MNLELVGRAFYYGRRHGLGAFFKRSLIGCKRMLACNRLVLFSCDLATLNAAAKGGVPGEVEQKRSEAELSKQDLAQMESIGFPKAVRRHISERFTRGASLWLSRVDGKVAGYGWTLRGKTVVPHFFPLEIDDVHLFDFFVFPMHRGRGINVALVNHILGALAAERKGRAFIEAADWNTSQLRSLNRMPFRKIGYARKLCVFGKTFVMWDSGS